MTRPLVYVVLLNWNNSDDTAACAAALRGDRYPNRATVIVDNGSSDGSAARLRASFPEIPLIASPVNRGFAGGVNQGLQYAAAQGADYALLLNSDIQIDPDLITRLVEAAEREPRPGVLGPRIYHDRARGVISLLGFRATRSGLRPVGWRARDDGRLARERVDAIAGCAMLISAEALRRVGLFDERFFFYFEDVDFCLRVADAGLGVALTHDVAIEHEMGGATRGRLARRQFLLASSRVRFLQKHYRRFRPLPLALSELRELVNQLRSGVQPAIGYLAGLWVGLRTLAPEEVGR